MYNVLNIIHKNETCTPVKFTSKKLYIKCIFLKSFKIPGKRKMITKLILKSDVCLNSSKIDYEKVL